jgi:hypothetical protein
LKVVVVELFVFKGVLTLSATGRNEKITFLPIFGLNRDVVCLCSIHVDFLVFSIPKVQLRFSKFKFVQSCLSLGCPKEEFDAKTQTKNLALLSL